MDFSLRNSQETFKTHESNQHEGRSLIVTCRRESKKRDR